MLREIVAQSWAEGPWRFAGANIYWLGLDENVGGVHYPTPFRIRDALTTAAGMGARVVRAQLGDSAGVIGAAWLW